VKVLNWLHDRYIKDNNQLAVYDKGVSLTYGELFETAQTLAGKLKSLQRKRMAVFIENSLEAVVLIHGMMQADVEMVLINTRLTPREIISQLNDIDVDMVVTTSHDLS
jgi:O-succinylbenzoic acid--CoA ligase